MARGVAEKVDAEGDVALGIGLAIAIFIGLFAAGIALFVLEQGKVHTPSRAHAPSTGAAPVDSPPATSAQISE